MGINSHRRVFLRSDANKLVERIAAEYRWTPTVVVDEAVRRLANEMGIPGNSTGNNPHQPIRKSREIGKR